MKTVIYHSADYDGIFCREIARHFLGDEDVNYIGWNFGDAKIPFPDGGDVYILDLSPDCIRAENGDRALDLAHSIWIDHHKSSIEKHLAAIPGYRIDGVAACRLSWQWFSLHNSATRSLGENNLPDKPAFVDRKVSEPLAVRIAGEYDIWDKRDPRAEIFQFGLRSRELVEFDWANMFSMTKATIEEIEQLIAVGYRDILEPDGSNVPAVVCGLLKDGAVLQRYQQKQDADLVTYKSYRITWEGLDFIVLNTGRFNSLTFAALDKPETGHDALLGYMFNGKVWTVSLYHAKHRTDLDLSAIAVKYGGGGHRGACGFTCDKLPFLK